MVVINEKEGNVGHCNHQVLKYTVVMALIKDHCYKNACFEQTKKYIDVHTTGKNRRRYEFFCSIPCKCREIMRF